MRFGNVELEGLVNPDRDPADMVQFEPFGDGRWYIAYLAKTALGDGHIAITYYVEERGRLFPMTHAVSPELIQRIGLLW